MSDYLVELGTNPTARKLIGRAGLPIPIPQKLRRSSDPWEDQPLRGRLAVVGQHPGGALAEVLARTLAAAGAELAVAGGNGLLELFRTQGQAWGRQPTDASEDLRPDLLVFDASGFEAAGDVRALYEFFHPRVRSLRRCGRALVLTRPPAALADPGAAAAARGAEGFVRSLAKELGRKGSTAHVITVEQGAEARVEAVLRFLASDRSAYLSGQVIGVSDAVTSGSQPLGRRPLDGKLALVTGAAQGIGASISRAFAREGARVIVVDLPMADRAASQLTAEIGGELLLGDITDPGMVDLIASKVGELGGGLDAVIHNAGVTRDKTLGRMDDDRWDLVMNVNLLALITLDEGLRPLLRNGARVVCLSSVTGIAGNAGQSNYTTTKAGIIGYVQALAPQLASRGIAVNAVAPGFIETRMTAAMPVTTREPARRLCNLAQGGLPEDIAEVVTFLASPGAAGVTGQVVRVCGGNLIGA
jgi:3-oxoacyl-[acyl-carrier protein] reductase